MIFLLIRDCESLGKGQNEKSADIPYQEDRSSLLVLLALVAIFPVFFSYRITDGVKELNDLLGAVLTADSGSCFRSGSQLCILESTSAYPTLRSYVKVLLDSPEFL